MNASKNIANRGGLHIDDKAGTEWVTVRKTRYIVEYL